MVATDLKTEIKKLMEKRGDLETEMNVIIERLCQSGGPGLYGNLVDSEGFPRSDIDIPVVRADRNRLAGYNSQGVESISSSNRGSSVIGMDVDVSRPFAMVDEITEESPAADDGLQLGDQMVKFGNVEYSDNLLSKLASEAQKNQGHPVPMLVMRQGTLITLTVTPRTWRGRGLLGCNFRIL